MTTAQKVIKLLEDKKILREENCNQETKIEFVSCDSRSVKPNTIFFCKGKHYKPEYLTQAINEGATIYVSEEKFEDVDLQYIIVNDIQKAMAIVAAEFYEYSFKDLITTGITGTKGKTTVTMFIKNILDEYTASDTPLSCTIRYYTGITDEPAHNTTPEPIDLQRFFYESKKTKAKYATMEISSQSYKRDRAYGVTFDNGIFINIVEDHISNVEHPTFEDYLQCKIQLLKNSKRAIVNKNMDYFDVVCSECKGKELLTYGTDATATYYYTNVKKLEKGFEFDAISEKFNYNHRFKISMLGRFNIENALAAITLSKQLGVDDDSIQRGLLKTYVKGRMDAYERDGVTVIVDYAHNRLSYTKLYESLKLDYPDKRIISVGGTHGSKAYNRRKDFGEIVGDNSDYIYITALDPQDEKVEDICKDIALHIKDQSKYEIVPDRKTAVEKAITNAKPGDLIVIMGKGEETYQVVNGELEKYESDLAIVKRMLKY